LNRFGLGRQVNEGINGGAPDGDALIPKQVRQQRNGGRTDPPDNLKSHQMKAFIVALKKSSQQRQRTPRPLDQVGFRFCPDLRVFGHQAIFPVTHLGRVYGGIRTPGLSEYWNRQNTKQRADDRCRMVAVRTTNILTFRSCPYWIGAMWV
jgi:hypothetical protein